MKYILFLFIKSFSYLLIGGGFYIVYMSNLDKFRKNNDKVNIARTKFSLRLVIFVLAICAIGTLWEAIQLLV